MKAFQKALVCHQEAKELLYSFLTIRASTSELLEEVLAIRETGRAMWVMAQAQAEENREGDDWKE